MHDGKRPLVSVVVPTYNQEQYIGDALDSLVSQDYERLEIVVRDDGSKDHTPEIVADYGRRFPERIVVLPGGVNLGITGNCNEILRECTGKYVAMVAGDDLALPGKISKQVAWLEEDERRVVCYHDVEVFESETNRRLYHYSERHPLRGGSLRELIHYPAFCAAVSVMLRRSSIPAGLFDARIPMTSDWLLLMETLLNSGVDNPGAGFIPGVFARYRRHAGNITLRADDFGLDETLRALGILGERDASLSDEIRHARSERMATYGFRALKRGNLVGGVRLLSAAGRSSVRGVGRSLMNAVAFVGVGLRQRTVRR